MREQYTGSKYMDERVAKISLDNTAFIKSLAEIQDMVAKVDRSITQLGNENIDATKLIQAMNEVSSSAKKAADKSIEHLSSIDDGIDDIATNIQKGLDLSNTLDDIQEDTSLMKRAILGIQDALLTIGDNVSFGNISKAYEAMVNTISGTDLGRVISGSFEAASNQIQNQLSILDIAIAGFISTQLTKLEGFARQFGGGFIDGFAEYEDKINSVQTIMANTEWQGKGIQEVTKVLEDMNVYADKTIYSFKEMTYNLGTFTAAGVGLEESAKAIEGFSNLAALSGTNSSRAAGAMYQLSQALAAGRSTLMDWNSIVQAGMGGKLLQDSLRNTAKEMGVAIDMTKTFRDSLQSGWLTTDVWMKTLEKFANSKSAQEAATQVKTFSQLIETVKESIGSGWSASWETILGNFVEAKQYWTDISNAISAIILNVQEVKLPNGTIKQATSLRDAILEIWASSGGRDAMFSGVARMFESALAVIDTFRDSLVESMGGVDKLGQKLADGSRRFEDWAKRVKESTSDLTVLKDIAGVVGSIFTLLGTSVNAIFTIFGKLTPVISAFVSGLLSGSSALTTIKDTFDNISQFIKNFANDLTVLDSVVVMFNKLGSTISSVINFAIKILSQFGTALLGVIPDRLFVRGTDLIGLINGILDITLSWLNSLDGINLDFGWLDTIGNIFSSLYKNITSLGSVFGALFGSLVTGFKYLQGLVFPKSLSEEEFNKISESIDKMRKKFDEIKKQFQPLIDIVNKAVEPFIKAFKDLTINDIISASVGIGLLELSKMLFNVTEQIVKTRQLFTKKDDDESEKKGFLSMFLGDLPKKIKELKDSLSDFVTGFSITSIAMSAIAIGGLAVAVNELSKVPIEKAATGLATLGATVLILVKTFESTKNLMDKKSISESIASVILLAGLAKAINETAKALAILTQIPMEQLGTGIVGFYVVIEELKRVIASAMTVKVDSGIKILVGMLGITTALSGMVRAVESLSKVKATSLAKALGGLTVIVIELKATAREMSTVDFSLKSSAALILLIGTLRSVTQSIQKLAEIPFANQMQSLATLSALVLLLMGITKNLNQFDVTNKSAINASLVALALNAFTKPLIELTKTDIPAMTVAVGGLLAIMSSLIIALDGMNRFKIDKEMAINVVALGSVLKLLAGVIQDLSKIKIEEMGTAMGGIIGVLSSLIVTLRLLPKNKELAESSAAMLALGVAINLFAKPIKELAKFDIAQVGIGVGGLVSAIAGLVAVAKLAGTSVTTAGAANITLIATAILLLGQTIKTMASIDPEKFGQAIAALAVSIGALIGMAMAIKTLQLETTLFAINTTFGLIAVSGLAIAATLTVLTTMFESLGKAGPRGVKAISESLSALADEVIKLAPKLTKMSSVVIAELLKMAPQFVRDLLEAIVSSLDVVNEYLPTILEKLEPSLITLFEKLPNTLKKINWLAFTNALVDLLGQVIGGALSGISATLGPLVDIVSTVFSAIIDTIGSVLKNVLPLVTELVKSVTPIIESAIEAVREVIKELIPYIPELVDIIVTGMTKMAPVVEAFLSGVNTILETLKPVVQTLIEELSKIIQRLPELLGGVVDVIIDLLNNLGDNIVNILDGLGRNITSIVDSLGGGISAIIDSIGGLISTITDIVVRPLTAISDLISSIGSGIKDAFSGVADVFSSIADIVNSQLTGVANVINSIGAAAMMSGLGFAALSDGVVKLTKTNLADLASSLGATAKGIGEIMSTIGGREDGKALSSLAQFATAMVELSRVGDGVKNGMATIIDSMTSVSSKSGEISGGINTISNTLKTLRSASKGVKSSFDAMSKSITSTNKTIKSISKSMVSEMRNMGRNMQSAFSKSVKGLGRQALNPLNNAIKQLRSRGSQAKRNAEYIGNMIGEGLAAGMNKSVRKVERAAEKLIKAAEKASKKKARIHSPSRLFRDEVGYMIGAGTAEGIDNSVSLVVKSMGNMITGAHDAVGSVANEMQAILNDTLGEVDTVLRPIIEPVLNEDAMTTLNSSLSDLSVGMTVPIGLPGADIDSISSSSDKEESKSEQITNYNYTINAEGNTGDDIVSAIRTYDFLHGS